MARTEREWLGSGPGTEQFLPWMPLSVPRFVMLLTDAVAVSRGTSFLDVGCGPGTKVLLAEKLYGLDGHGIDRVPDYVQAARDLGVSAEQADAITWCDYGRYDILYLNKPCHGPLEALLERRVMGLMKPGAVLIMANAADRPPADWELVAAEWDTNSGVWRKPG